MPKVVVLDVLPIVGAKVGAVVIFKGGAVDCFKVASQGIEPWTWYCPEVVPSTEPRTLFCQKPMINVASKS